MRAATAAWLFLFLGLPVLSGRADPASAPSPLDRAEAVAARDRLRAFVASAMTGPEGAIRVNAVADRAEIPGEARNGEILSEAVGQRMELALAEDDAAAFSAQWKLARRRFAGPSAALAWKLAPDLSCQVADSATLDDWRVAEACADAARRWNDREAAAFGRHLAETLAASGAPWPPPALSLKTGTGTPGPIPLCYLRLPAMRACSAAVPALAALQGRSVELLHRAVAASGKGMVPYSYDPATGAFSTGPVSDVYTLLTALNLQAIGAEPEWVAGALAVRHAAVRALPEFRDPAKPDAGGAPAGAAVYALFSRLALRAGDRATAGLALRQALRFQNRPGAPFAGGIGGAPVYSFDQLEVLLALAEYLRD